ncbi:GDP/GTP exchange factor Sec2p [Rhodotorula toruloides]|uniref:GDP/GTP exchange factor Sec2p n=1 Tax=Rhodotorula toruloides TaxID=5286 RepID=A0A511KJ09_RHOTO|nr:GDP/GTP exchange factor Sec2p [Rhodotorula toruloides]
MAGSDHGEPSPSHTRRNSGTSDFQDAQDTTDDVAPAESARSSQIGEQDAPAHDVAKDGREHTEGDAAIAHRDQHAVTPAAASISSLDLPLKNPQPSLEPAAASNEELIAILRAQITDLASQVTSLNSKLVKSYTTRGELEDELHEKQEQERAMRKRVADLEKDKEKWEKEIEAGGWVEKSHVQGEMQRLMAKVVEETHTRETAVQAHTALETEVENLTSNLFSEANKMVAFERLARARAEEKTRTVEEAGVSMQALLEEVQVGLKDTVLKLEKRDEEVATLKRRLAALGEPVEEDQVGERESAEGDVGAIVFSDGEHLTPIDTREVASAGPSSALSPSNLSAPKLLTSVLPYHEFLAFVTYLRQTRVSALSRPPEGGSFSHPALSTRSFAVDPTHPHYLTPAQLLAPHLLLSTHLSQPFLKRCVEEDSDPALRLDLAPGLGFLSRRGVGTAVVDGTLLIEPLHSGIEFPSDKCAMCGCSLEKWLPNSGNVRGAKTPTTSVAAVNQTMRKLGSSLFSRSSSNSTPTLSSVSSSSSTAYHSHTSSTSSETFTFPPPQTSASHHPHDASLLVHLFRISDTSAQRYPICPSYCLARLRAVCEFWTYIRVIERGLLLEEGFRFVKGRGDSNAKELGVRKVTDGIVSPAKKEEERGEGKDGLGISGSGAAASGGEGVEAKDFETEDTHGGKGESAAQGTPKIVVPEASEEAQNEADEHEDEAEGRRSTSSDHVDEGKPSNSSTTSLSPAKGSAPPRPSRSSARDSPAPSATPSPPGSPRVSTAPSTPPALPPRRSGPPKHPSLSTDDGGDSIIGRAIGWEDRCWSEVVRLKESVFWTRVAAVAPDGGETRTMVAKIAVIFYSTYGHVRTLAEAIAAEAKTTGVEVDLLQFPEILTEEIRGKMHAAPRGDYPDVKPDDLTHYDGFLMGFPTRYGRAPAAVSAFFDATGGLWAKGALIGKFASVFTSTASQHGGQETTALTTVPFFAHHGITFVSPGYAAADLTDINEIVGGSAYGAAGIASGDGSRGISEKELNIARNQATYFANTVKTFVAGKAALEKHASGLTATEGAAAATTGAAAAGAATTATSVGAHPEEGAPALGKAIPTESATPYTVDDPTPAATQTPKENVATSQPAQTTPAAAEPAAAPAQKETTPAPAPAATPAPAAAPASKPAQQKKKGGIFAMCCGGNSSNYES